MYDKRLQEFDLIDVKAAVARLMETPRPEFEKAFPDLGTVVSLVQQIQRARLNVWQKCPACAAGMDGWQEVLNDAGQRIGVTRCHCWKAWQSRQAPPQVEDRKSAAAGAA